MVLMVRVAVILYIKEGFVAECVCVSLKNPYESISDKQGSLVVIKLGGDRHNALSRID